jgi:hypothetical protein
MPSGTWSCLATISAMEVVVVGVVLGIALVFLFGGIDLASGLHIVNRILGRSESAAQRRTGAESSELGPRLLGWVIFVFLAALIPIPFIAYLRSKAGLSITLDHLLASGELIIISTILIISTIGDLMLSLRARHANSGDAIAVGASLLFIVPGCLVYGNNASLCSTHESPGAVVWTAVMSGALFLLAAVIGAGNIWKSSREKVV